IAMLLFAGGFSRPVFHVPLCEVLACRTATALVTLFDGWRLVKRTSMRVTERPTVGGNCAEAGGAFAWHLATSSGIPVPRTAASLAFTTLLGLVPVFTVAFTYVARYLPFEQSLDALEPLLLRFLLPGSGTVVRQYLAIFMQKASELSGINTAFVALTALLL